MTIRVGSNFYNFPSFFKNPTIRISGLVISTGDAMMCIISLVALVLLAYVIQKTRLGRRCAPSPSTGIRPSLWVSTLPGLSSLPL